MLDDDESALLLARRSLERAGYRVSLAQTPAEAYSVVRSDEPDLVIVDYYLAPTQTGLHFLDQLREQGSQIPSILVTGFTDEGRVIEALRAGVADLVPKVQGYLEYLPAVVDKVLAPIRLQQGVARAEALEKRERYYRGIAEAIPHLVWTAREDGSLDYLSKQWLEYTGLPESEQVGFLWIQAVVHPDDRTETENVVLAAVKEGLGFEIEHRLRRADGRYRWFKSKGVLLSSTDVQPSGKWFGTCTDIDEQKRGEREREQLLERERIARTEAERATRVKDDFVATLSHELRTPLNAIVGWAELLMRDSGDPARRKKGLEVILRNARIQAEMVDDILDMSSVLSGRLRLDVHRVELGELVEQVMATVHPAADAKGIEILRELFPVPAIQGDPGRLQQVIWNLVMNAIKFTDKGGSVRIGLATEDDTVVVRVTDTGRGIAPEFLPHVFDRFSQEVGGSTRGAGGLGLGLAIVRQLTELHGGSVAAFSDGNQLGSRFELRFPIPSPTAAGHSPLETRSPRPNNDEAILHELDVLVVEDEADARELVEQLLTDHGARVVVAASGPEGLHAFRRRQPDVVISDIGMPGMDGYEFMERLREEESDLRLPMTPSLALTALARSEDRHRASAAGFQSHLAKPVSARELVAVVAAMAGRRPLPLHTNVSRWRSENS
jgi:PAS domain S-box-containing protein